MRMKRRMAAVAAGVAMAGAVSVVPATAQEAQTQTAKPATLAASATAEALELSLFGEDNTVTLGASSLAGTLEKVDATGRGVSLSDTSAVNAAAAAGGAAADPELRATAAMRVEGN